MTNSTTSDVSENLYPHIKQEIVGLCDAYKEFQYFCAFYCKSSSVLIRCCSLEMDSDYAEGMARVARLVIDKSHAIDEQLKQLLRKA